MRIADMNWMQVEDYLRRDNRAVLPLGSVEQHAYLSLATDALLAERVAVEAAEPLGVPVYPALAFGLSPYFMAYPGTVTLRAATYEAVVTDVLDSLARSGFRRILIVNGHGGNVPAEGVAASWSAAHPGCEARMHHWWKAPRTSARVEEVDSVAPHASWMESFPWTRVPLARPPATAKAIPELADRAGLSAEQLRERLGDGSFGGLYQRPDEQMASIWDIAVRETRERLEGPWTA